MGCHSDLDRLELWAQVYLMRLNKSKCKILHLGYSNPLFNKITRIIMMQILEFGIKKVAG